MDDVDQDEVLQIYRELKKLVAKSPSVFTPHGFHEIGEELNNGSLERAIGEIMETIVWLLMKHMIYGNAPIIPHLQALIRLVPDLPEEKTNL